MKCISLQLWPAEKRLPDSQNRVVEHKEGVRRGVFCAVIRCCIWTSRGMHSSQNASPLGCAIDLPDSHVPECLAEEGEKTEPTELFFLFIELERNQPTELQRNRPEPTIRSRFRMVPSWFREWFRFI